MLVQPRAAAAARGGWGSGRVELSLPTQAGSSRVCRSGAHLGLLPPIHLHGPQSPPETTGLLHPGPWGQLRLEEAVCTEHEGHASSPLAPRASSGVQAMLRPQHSQWPGLSAQGWAAERPRRLTTPQEPRVLRSQEGLSQAPAPPSRGSQLSLVVTCSSPIIGRQRREPE